MWERVFAVNVDGTMRLMRAVIPAMLAAGGGSIVNIASEAALRGSAAGARLHRVEARRRRPHEEHARSCTARAASA